MRVIGIGLHSAASECLIPFPTRSTCTSRADFTGHDGRLHRIFGLEDDSTLSRVVMPSDTWGILGAGLERRFTSSLGGSVLSLFSLGMVTLGV